MCNDQLRSIIRDALPILERAANLLSRLDRMRLRKAVQTVTDRGYTITVADFPLPIRVEGELKGAADAPRAWIKGRLSDPD